MPRKNRRISDETASVLAVFEGDPKTERFGLEILKHAGLKSGSLYPILHRLEERQLLLSRWEDEATAHAAGRRPRRLYRMNPDRPDDVSRLLSEWRSARRTPSTPAPAFSRRRLWAS